MIGGQQCKVNYTHYVKIIMCAGNVAPRTGLCRFPTIMQIYPVAEGGAGKKNA